MKHNLFPLGLVVVLALLTMGLTAVLVTAQQPLENDSVLEMRDVYAGLLQDEAGHRTLSPRRALRVQGAGATADVRPPGSFDVVLLGEDFEWFAGERWTTSGLWHGVLGYLDVGYPYSRTHSLVRSMWFGQDLPGNYDTGAAAWGWLTTTRLISIPTSAVSVTVSFWSWEETEQTGSTDPLSCDPPPALCLRDGRGLFITGTISTSLRSLWNTVFTPTVEQQWHQVTADISAYRGQEVRLGFLFHSVNAAFNDNEGWYVDDIAVVAHGVPVQDYDTTASWVQSFYEDYPNPTPDREIHLDRVEADGVTPWQVTNDGEEQSNVAVAAHPVGDIPIVWAHSYTNTHGVYIGDIEYMALKPDGTTSVPLTKVTDNSALTFPGVEDLAPAVTVNPADSSTIIAWTHCLSCPVSYATRVFNTYYAIYDRDGGQIAGPVALSSNTSNRVRDYHPAVEAFPSGNVFIAWVHRDLDAGLQDVYYTVVDRSGDAIKPVDNLSGTPGSPGDATVARLADGNILVVWHDQSPSLELLYAVVDSDGSVAKGPTTLTNYGSSGIIAWAGEALGLANGNSIIAWMEVDFRSAMIQIRYAVLGSTYNVVNPPTLLPNPYNAAANGYVSMVADEADSAILTWAASDYPYLHLYYARLDNQGNVLTEPTIWRQTRGSTISSSSRGYGVGQLPVRHQVYLPLVLRDAP